MTEQFDEKFSAFMDGEQHADTELTQRLRTDEALRARWGRYHLVRDVMTNHYRGMPAIDISTAVRNRLETEPTVLAPRSRPLVTAVRHMGKQAAGYALAATVAGAAVFTVQQYNLADTKATMLTSIESGKSIVPIQANRQLATNAAVQNKLSGYLVTHNEYSVSAKMQGMMPYMRIVSHPATERPKQ